MIRTLSIKDFAIISQLELDWENGMTVLSGETGAGKSIIINAIKLILGAKASPDLIRTGAKEAVVEALISLMGPHRAVSLAKLEALGLLSQDEELTVRRVFPRSGRGRVYINGSLQPLAVLRDLMRGIIDISGQHEHVGLLDSAQHLAIVDRYAGIEREVAAFTEAFWQYSSLKRERRKLREALDERSRRLDFVNYQIDELASAKLRVGEVEEVSEALKRLNNAERLQSALQEGVDVLYDSDNSLFSMLGMSLASLRKASQSDARFGNVCDCLEQALSAIEEGARELRQIDIEEAAPDQIEALEERLSILDRLERKYRCKADALPELQENLEAERAALMSSDSRLAELEAVLQKTAQELIAQAEVLSRARSQAAVSLSEKASACLRLLAMPNAQICIRHERSEGLKALRATGYDSIEFLLAPNLGEEPKSLAKIASGGELSRVLLAIKRVLIDKDEVACYIFDEVDTGIGGKTATDVAWMLKELSACHQVLCITHLASIACYADAHYVVSKTVVDARTQTEIVRVDEGSRVAEIARMLGARALTQKTLEHAAEMLAQARMSLEPST